MKIRTQLFFATMAAILVTASASATTLVRLSLDQLTQASTEIVRGHVASQETLWNAAHKRIYTYTTVAVDQTYKGNPASTLIVQQPGGTVGKVHVFVAGTILFHSQADYVLFLERSATDPSKFLPVGMMQGAYRIYRDATTQEEKLILPLGSLIRGSPGPSAVAAVSDRPPAPGERRYSSTLAGPSVPVRQFQREISTALSRPLTIPHGTAIPLAIRSAQFAGVRRMDVQGRTTSALFPNPGLVIPAGSALSGMAERVGDAWEIAWTAVSIGGKQVLLSARSTAPAVGSLRGRLLVVNVR
jgi:hypothetical protein